jgi:hypothetical protein
MTLGKFGFMAIPTICEFETHEDISTTKAIVVLNLRFILKNYSISETKKSCSAYNV